VFRQKKGGKNRKKKKGSKKGPNLVWSFGSYRHKKKGSLGKVTSGRRNTEKNKRRKEALSKKKLV